MRYVLPVLAATLLFPVIGRDRSRLDTYIVELAVIEYPKCAVGISILIVVVLRIKLFPVVADILPFRYRSYYISRLTRLRTALSSSRVKTIIRRCNFDAMRPIYVFPVLSPLLSFPVAGRCLSYSVYLDVINKKLSYRRETARQLHTSFSAHSLIVHFTEHRTCFYSASA